MMVGTDDYDDYRIEDRLLSFPLRLAHSMRLFFYRNPMHNCPPTNAYFVLHQHLSSCNTVLPLALEYMSVLGVCFWMFGFFFQQDLG